MKKIIALVLAFTMVFALGLTAFADSEELTGEGSAQASGRVAIGEQLPLPQITVSVDISWENTTAFVGVSPEYYYTWNPETLKYTRHENENRLATPTGDGEIVFTITNRSNVEIGYEITAETVEGYTVVRTPGAVNQESSGSLDSAAEGIILDDWETDVGEATTATYSETYTVTGIPSLDSGLNRTCINYTVTVTPSVRSADSRIRDTDMA